MSNHSQNLRDYDRYERYDRDEFVREPYDRTIYRRDPRPYEYERPASRSSVGVGVLVGIFATIAVAVAVMMATGTFSRVVNKFLPQRTAVVATVPASGTTDQAESVTIVEETSTMISSDSAISRATAAVGGDTWNVSANLVTGGDAPHYVVEFDAEDAHYSVDVDAYSGDVWSVRTSVDTFEEVVDFTEE